ESSSSKNAAALSLGAHRLIFWLKRRTGDATSAQRSHLAKEREDRTLFQRERQLFAAGVTNGDGKAVHMGSVEDALHLGGLHVRHRLAIERHDLIALLDARAARWRLLVHPRDVGLANAKLVVKAEPQPAVGGLECDADMRARITLHVRLAVSIDLVVDAPHV